MKEIPPQDQAVELIKTPELPLQKCLLPDPKPNHRLTAGSSDSALSSDSSYERLLKKTRDLPNLSDCHSCGCHINHTNPHDRLQTLGSFWRIVLLCRKCVRRLGSGQLCSYCFSEAGEECFRCRSCDRKVHKDCVVRYRTLAPWCYCSSDLEFSVCVDCWVPKSLESSVRVYKRRGRKRQCVAGSPKGKVENGNSKNIEIVSKDVQKKNAVATKAKENALRKVVVAKRAMELAYGALELVSKKSKTDPSENTVPRLVDDAELAFQLHRAMNSSPRISRSSCLVNSTCLSVPRNLDFSGNSFGSQSSLSQAPNQNGSQKAQNTEVCPDKSNGETNAPVSKLAVYARRYGNRRCSFLRKFSTTKSYQVYVRRACRDPRSRLNYVKQVGLVYTRKRNKNKESREIGRVIDGKCENVDCNGMLTESQTSSEPGRLQDEFHCNNCPESSCDNNGALHDGKSNQLRDRYILKYRKRSSHLKTRKKENPCVEYHDGSKAKAEGMSINYSPECKTLPSASVQVSSVAMDASACSAGHQNRPPVLKRYSRLKTKKLKK